MRRIIKWLLRMYVKQNPDLYGWSISVDDKTDISIYIRDYSERGCPYCMKEVISQESCELNSYD